MTAQGAKPDAPPAMEDVRKPAGATSVTLRSEHKLSNVPARWLTPSPALPVDDLRRPLASALDDEFEQPNFSA